MKRVPGNGKGILHLGCPLLWSSRFDLKHFGLGGPASCCHPRVEPTATWGGACPGTVTTGDGWVHKQPGEGSGRKAKRKKGQRHLERYWLHFFLLSPSRQLRGCCCLSLCQGRQAHIKVCSTFREIFLLKNEKCSLTHTHIQTEGKEFYLPERIMRIKWNNIHTVILKYKWDFQMLVGVT